MRIAIFGGTGRTGRLLVEAALRSGHEVRLLSRRPLDGQGTETVLGDALSPQDLRALVRGSLFDEIHQPSPSGTVRFMNS